MAAYTQATCYLFYVSYLESLVSSAKLGIVVRVGEGWQVGMHSSQAACTNTAREEHNLSVSEEEHY